jgi:hypothetical protein
MNKRPREEEEEATIRLINPSKKGLSPLGNSRPQLRPITKSKDMVSGPEESSDVPAPQTPEPPPEAEQISESDAEGGLLVPTKPELEKPAPTSMPKPVPGEPKSEAALIKTVSSPKNESPMESAPMPLFGGEKKPEDMKTKPAVPTVVPPKKPAAEKQPPVEKEPTPIEPEPTPVRSASTGD